jgi:hypothetical protein
MRFLRHKFKDPFTGKDEWRLLHAGPGGMIIDSKVKPLTGNAQGSTGASGFASSSFGNSSSFGSSSSGSFGSNSASTDAEIVVPTLPQRPPAVSASGTGDAAASSDAAQNGLPPLVPAVQSGGTLPAQNAAGAQTQQQGAPGANPNLGLGTQPAQALGQNVASGQNGAQPGATPLGGTDPNQPPGVNGRAPVSGAAQAGAPTDPTQAVRNLLANPNAQTPQGFASTSGRTGVISSGGIAGVASNAKGHSIKIVNDQDDYSLWEFVYDLPKDATRGLAAAQAGLQQNQGQKQTPGQFQTLGNQNQFGSPSQFGSPTQFGSSNQFGSPSQSQGAADGSSQGQPPAQFPRRGAVPIVPQNLPPNSPP